MDNLPELNIETIDTIRRARGITQTEIGEVLQRDNQALTQSAIGHKLNGRRRFTANEAKRLAELFNVDLSLLFEPIDVKFSPRVIDVSDKNQTESETPANVRTLTTGGLLTSRDGPGLLRPEAA